MNPRTVATQVLTQVVYEHHSLTAILLTAPLQKTQANLVKEMCYGVSRWYFRLSLLLEKLLPKPLKSKDKDLHILLLIGLYQLLFLNVPTHTAVTETVDVTRDLKKPWASKLVNGVLRNFLRQKTEIIENIENTITYKYSHPEWLSTFILKAWPNEGEKILEANNQHPPLSLRINCQRTKRDSYLKELSNQNIEAYLTDASPSGIILEKPRQVTQIPGFLEGKVSVQDTSAQLAAFLLELSPGQTVLDACAAPGGKTTHILECQPDLTQLAIIDIDAKRLEMIKQNVDRLNLKLPPTQWVCENAERTEHWWKGECFDRILIDAPCSGTGVIRRHPDIKLLHQPADIDKLAKEQLKLLKALWPLLKPDGILVYATCSILPQENEEVLSQFLKDTPDAHEKKIEAAWGRSVKVGRQILPGADNLDGFYYARLTKTRP